MYQLTQHEELLSKEIVDCLFKVHNALGPGLLERIYEICFCHELLKKGIPYLRQVHLPVYYDGLYFEEGLKCDVFVDDSVICELKAVDIVNPVWEAQVLSHLKLSNKHVGFLVNFNVVRIKEGIRRFSKQ